MACVYFIFCGFVRFFIKPWSSALVGVVARRGDRYRLVGLSIASVLLIKSSLLNLQLKLGALTSDFSALPGNLWRANVDISCSLRIVCSDVGNDWISKPKFKSKIENKIPVAWNDQINSNLCQIGSHSNESEPIWANKLFRIFIFPLFTIDQLDHVYWSYQQPTA